ncbi:MAG: winged helix-turn-helix transcriptional regulator [Actinomycetota bacterium]|nr:winged helix-turn-helix transcriptional regulator [Actinomycetota bacterium]MDQ3647686.1 winged helix-turn-helix transcriptional regulator [Actinomycetota bacterium]
MLSQLLRELEEAGVLQRRKLPPPAASWVYELTEWGTELEPVVIALGRWGARAPMSPEGLGMSFDSHILSLRTLFEPALAGFEATLELRLGDNRFRAEVADGRFEVEPAEAQGPEAIIETDAGTLIALVHGRRQLAEALEAGDVDIEGDQEAISRFLGLFPLPEPAGEAPRA